MAAFGSEEHWHPPLAVPDCGFTALLAAFCTPVMAGCANPEAASRPNVKTIANKVFTCVCSFPVVLKSITTQPWLDARRATPLEIFGAHPVLQVMEPSAGGPSQKCDPILYTIVV